MAMLAFSVIAASGLLIVFGVIVNVYLYSRGAIFRRGRPGRMRTLETMVLSQEAVADHNFSLSLGVNDSEVNSYLRRLLACFVWGLAILGLLVAFLVSTLTR
jgi:hypothetical protein